MPLGGALSSRPFCLLTAVNNFHWLFRSAGVEWRRKVGSAVETGVRVVSTTIQKHIIETVSFERVPCAMVAGTVLSGLAQERQTRFGRTLQNGLLDGVCRQME